MSGHTRRIGPGMLLPAIAPIAAVLVAVTFFAGTRSTRPIDGDYRDPAGRSARAWTTCCPACRSTTRSAR